MPLKFWQRKPQPLVASEPVWAVTAHFVIGQQVINPHEPDMVLRVEATTADRVRTGNPFNILPAGAGNDVLWWGPEQLRHQQDCPPCEADTVLQVAIDTQHSTTYWSQWDQADRDLYETITDGMVQDHDSRGWSFGADAPVPLWMRTCFDGHLGIRESPSLDLGRIGAPLDWWSILAEHEEDGFRIVNAWEAEGAPDWDRITIACDLLREAGYTAVPWVQLELEVTDGQVGAAAYQDGLHVDGSIDSGTYERLLPVIGTATAFPHSFLIRPHSHTGPGIDRTRTYTGHHDYDLTEWLWFDDNYVPPTTTTAAPVNGVTK
jgi:hypothetical protein